MEVIKKKRAKKAPKKKIVPPVTIKKKAEKAVVDKPPITEPNIGSRRYRILKKQGKI